ncbi:MAG: sulfite exporter TauE/SafE family protein [Vampirovibrio sp.]|nr:sulfite exporter TauE/SafE family protein [Vampirovibrio sp.]
MDPLLFLIFVTGLVAGIFSGLLGIGGAVLLIPAAMYLPPVFGLLPFGIKAATGIAMTQCLGGTLAASRIHYQKGTLIPGLVLVLGAGSFIGGFIGGYGSQFFSDISLKLIYMCLLFTVILFFLRSLNRPDVANGHLWTFDHRTFLQEPKNWRFLGLTTAIAMLSGLLGIGGAVFLFPVLHGILKVPVKQAIGTCTGLVLLTAMTGFTGKWISGQIPLAEGLAVTIGALIGGTIGAKIAHLVPIFWLRLCFLCIVTLAFARVGLEMLQRFVL